MMNHNDHEIDDPQDCEDTMNTAGRAVIIVTHAGSGLPFDERTVPLQPDQPLRVGRLSTKAESEAKDNLNFDCKVLSRKHANVSFDYNEQQFYLEDTQSSNGTFINKNNNDCDKMREVNKITPEQPYPIYTGDGIRFGVEVKDAKSSMSHGCIVCTV